MLFPTIVLVACSVLSLLMRSLYPGSIPAPHLFFVHHLLERETPGWVNMCKYQHKPGFCKVKVSVDLMLIPDFVNTVWVFKNPHFPKRIMDFSVSQYRVLYPAEGIKCSWVVSNNSHVM